MEYIEQFKKLADEINGVCSQIDSLNKQHIAISNAIFLSLQEKVRLEHEIRDLEEESGLSVQELQDLANKDEENKSDTTEKETNTEL